MLTTDMTKEFTVHSCVCNYVIITDEAKTFDVKIICTEPEDNQNET
jgi:hypothetical protein